MSARKHPTLTITQIQTDRTAPLLHPLPMAGNHNTSTTAQQTRVSSSSSSSYSSSSSSSRSYPSSPFSSVLPQTPRISTLDQLWRDISFPSPPPISLPHHPSPNPNPNPSSTPPSLRTVTLQDFLAGPSKDKIHSNSAPDGGVDDFPLPPPPPPPPPTALSLNSSPLDFEFSSGGLDDTNNAPPFVASLPTVGLFPFFPNERSILENPCGLGGGGGDRRHKRMMKNRESAARSRARKQAYTNELELEVAHLEAENEKLKKQYAELRKAMAAQNSAKRRLQRTLTAPF